MPADLPDFVRHPSPNHEDRRGVERPNLIVLHYTEMATCDEALARLCDPDAEVSAHYLISEAGEIWQLVDDDRRAWHAGAGQWGGVTDVNSHSLGIELSNTGITPFAATQMNVLEALLARLMVQWQIAPERVIAHSDMAPSRKSDPGRRFDWRRLALGGLSVWPDKATSTRGRFIDHAAAFGYPANEDPDDVLAAFRLRFRPWHDGPADGVDTALAADLAHRFPVDRAGHTT